MVWVLSQQNRLILNVKWACVGCNWSEFSSEPSFRLFHPNLFLLWWWCVQKTIKTMATKTLMKAHRDRLQRRRYRLNLGIHGWPVPGPPPPPTDNRIHRYWDPPGGPDPHNWKCFEAHRGLHGPQKACRRPRKVTSSLRAVSMATAVTHIRRCWIRGYSGYRITRSWTILQDCILEITFNISHWKICPLFLHYSSQIHSFHLLNIAMQHA